MHPLLRRGPRAVPAPSPVVAQVADQAGRLAIELVDVAGNIDVLSAAVTGQAAAFERLQQAADGIQAGNSAVSSAAEVVREASRRASTDAAASQAAVQDSLAAIRDLVGWVGSVGGEIDATRTALTGIAATASSINAIAERTHVLALNARIEAARSGEAGKGFTVIADTVRQLADQSMEAAASIDTALQALGRQLSALSEQGDRAQVTAEAVRGATGSIGGALETVSSAMAGVDEQVSAIAEAAAASADRVEEHVVGMTGVVDGAATSSRELDAARTRVHSLLDVAESLIGGIATMGIPTPDTPFIAAVQGAAADVTALLEQAVAAGQVRLEDLFDTDYRPVPGSDPVQHLTRFTALTDRLLPDVQEPLLDLDPRVAFAAAVDRNGYLPTHNRRFSQPQGADPVWNTAHCRNRRVFADRTGLAAARNTRPFLLQTYRRDMGGGTFVLMKDVSAPVLVRGRHWGAVRLAYSA